uniref:Uncharacterized protein n=1 Tax=Solanum lycopersicum TaxID=4081 RepID=A0A3Q7G6T0_SOLLC
MGPLGGAPRGWGLMGGLWVGLLEGEGREGGRVWGPRCWVPRGRGARCIEAGVGVPSVQSKQEIKKPKYVQDSVGSCSHLKQVMLTAENRASHLDGALKEWMRQIRNLKEEHDKFHKEETKILKEALAHQNSELQASRSIFCKTSSKLLSLDAQLQPKFE